MSGKSSAHVSFDDAIENYRRNTDWWVVFAAFELPDFQSSPIWISQKTGLSIETVVEALEGLSVIGYLKKENDTFSTLKGKEFIKLEQSGHSRNELLTEHALITQQVVKHLSDEPLAAIDHRCFASNVEILRELYSDVAKALEKAYKNSSSAKNKDRIFKMAFTAADVLTRKDQ